MDRLEELKGKYATVLEKVKDRGISLSHVHVQDNRLFIQGTAPSEQAKNAIWDQIKAVNPAYDDITVDLTIDSSLHDPGAEKASGAAVGGGQTTHTVVAGDTLWAIAKEHYGAGHLFTKIAEANHLADPNHVAIGTVLTIPPA